MAYRDDLLRVRLLSDRLLACYDSSRHPSLFGSGESDLEPEEDKHSTRKQMIEDSRELWNIVSRWRWAQ